MPYTAKTTRKGVCAICSKEFPKGTIVYFDATKSQGKHLAHKACYDKLLAERGGPKKPTGPVEIRSREKLDPPF